MEETAVQSPGFFDPTLFLLIGMLAIVYFMLIRPQNKRAKELQQMLGALEKGDEVVAASGILGKIRDIKGDYVSIEVSQSITLNYKRQQFLALCQKGTIDSINK